MMKRIVLIAFIAALHGVFGQNLLVQDMHFQNMNFINAAAGIQDSNMNHDIQLYGAHRIVPGNTYSKVPVLMVNYIGNVEKVKGRFMAGYVFDQYSYFTRNSIHFGYATTFRKGKHYFDLGVRSILNFDYAYMKRMDVDSSIYSAKSLDMLTDLDLGFQYRFKGLTIGLAGKNLFKNSLVNVYETFSNERVFYMNASYEHTFGEKFKLAAFFLPSYTTSFQLDLGLNAKFWNRLDVSYLFRLKEVRHIYRISGSITKNLYAGASFGHGHINSDLRTQLMIGVRF